MNLFTPGPVNISVAAQEAIGRPRMFHHRSEQFRSLMSSLTSHLKDAFLTSGDVLTLTSSGTGAMEAAVANLLSRGDKVLVPVSGKFSLRWAGICESYGMEIIRIELEPGEAPGPDSVVSALEADPDIGALLLTHCETSTGSLTDLKTTCCAVHDLERRSGREILIISDCITSLYVDELRMDDWGIDCAVAASQKGLLSPPGLAFVGLGERAAGRIRSSSSSRYYFDLRKYLKPVADQSASQSGRLSGHSVEPPFTPAIPLVDATLASLSYLEGLGLEPVWLANRSGASALRLLVEAAGMRPVAERQASGVVAFWTGELDPLQIARALEREHYIIVAQGQGALRGRSLRVSPIGKSPAMLRGFATAFSCVLEKMGRTLDMDTIKTEFDRLLEDCSIWE